MNDTSGGSTVYDFRGDYACSNGGNTATMTSTDYSIASSNWKPFKAKWTATINGSSFSVQYNGYVKSIISLDELTVELEGYQVR
jgi:hypothetical protein